MIPLPTDMAYGAGPKEDARIYEDEPHSTANPHKSDFLNLLDPKVDRNAVKRPKQCDYA